MVAMTTELLSSPDAGVLHHRDARGVHLLTLNDPASFNTLSQAVLGLLQQALQRVAADEQARVVVLAAAGTAFVRATTSKKCGLSPSWLTTKTCLPNAAA